MGPSFINPTQAALPTSPFEEFDAGPCTPRTSAFVPVRPEALRPEPLSSHFGTELRVSQFETTLYAQAHQIRRLNELVQAQQQKTQWLQVINGEVATAVLQLAQVMIEQQRHRIEAQQRLDTRKTASMPMPATPALSAGAPPRRAAQASVVETRQASMSRAGGRRAAVPAQANKDQTQPPACREAARPSRKEPRQGDRTYTCNESTSVQQAMVRVETKDKATGRSTTTFMLPHDILVQLVRPQNNDKAGCALGDFIGGLLRGNDDARALALAALVRGADGEGAVQLASLMVATYADADAKGYLTRVCGIVPEADQYLRRAHDLLELSADAYQRTGPLSRASSLVLSSRIVQAGHQAT